MENITHFYLDLLIRGETVKAEQKVGSFCRSGGVKTVTNNERNK
jgi:hypothetical protein